MSTYLLRCLGATGDYSGGLLNAICGIARVFVYLAWSIAWCVAPAAMDTLKRRIPRIRDMSFRAFRFSEISRSYVFPDRKKKILFFRTTHWERIITDGFNDTPHEIAFKDFPPRNINFRDYDLIVPQSLRDVRYLDEMRNLISDNPIPIPSMESILLCDDKYLLNKSLTANGFGHFIPKMGGALTYPYMLKVKTGERSDGCHLISDQQQEQALSNILTHPDYFTQDFIKGSYEHATHILFKNQRIVRALSVEYKFHSETPIKSKDKLIYTMICHCPYLDVFAAMLSSIGFNGLCCINYKVCDNHPFVLEINPRFGYSLCPHFYSFIRHAA
jgi:hypothetical protein